MYFIILLNLEKERERGIEMMMTMMMISEIVPAVRVILRPLCRNGRSPEPSRSIGRNGEVHDCSQRF